MAKPVVDGLERALAPQGVEVIRLSVTSRVGATLAGRYGVRGIPTLILFDGAGDPVLIQVGRLKKDSVLQMVTRLLKVS